MECRIRHNQTGPGQRHAKFIKGDVLAGLPFGEDFLPTLFDTTRACVSALRLRRKTPGRAPLPLPPDRRRGRHAKPHSRRTATHSRINRRQKPRAQIHRKRLTDACWPPYPARVLNQTFNPLGSPRRFRTVEIRSKSPLILKKRDSLSRPGSCRNPNRYPIERSIYGWLVEKHVVNEHVYIRSGVAVGDVEPCSGFTMPPTVRDANHAGHHSLGDLRHDFKHGSVGRNSRNIPIG